MNAVQAARRASLLIVSFLLIAGRGGGSSGRAETITLANGMKVEGSVGKIAQMGADPLKPIGPAARTPILVIDNYLTRTFVYSDLGRIKLGESPATAEERIEIDQRLQRVGRAVGGVGPIIRIDPFDEWGHRIFSMSTTSGTADVVQGITIITPKWTQVEAIQGPGSYVWMMRIATSSIPRQQLSKILYRQIDPANSEERLKIVRLYLQAERFQDARAELEQVIKDFPGLTRLQDQVKSLHQLSANRLLKEIELRREVGQYRLAIQMLEGFPSDGVAGEVLLKVRDTLKEMADQNTQGQTLLKRLGEHLAALKNDKTRAELKPIIDEIQRDLSANTLDRMADYLRLADDAGSTPETKLALAISGWLLGSGGGIENIDLSRSLVKIRDLVRRYMVTTRQPERDVILGEMGSLEGATPAYISKIIANMKPPVPTAGLDSAPIDVGNAGEVLGTGQPAVKPAAPEAPAANPPPAKAPEVPAPPAKAPPAPAAKKATKGKTPPPNPLDGCQPPADGGGVLDPVKPQALPALAAPAQAAPAAAALVSVDAQAPGAQQPGLPPGLLELTAKGVPEDPQLKYLVQLPPQYDPYRRYPCIVTLNGAGTTPLQQIDWWAGGYDAQAQTRFGQATRYGYIVIAPRWTREHQRKYEYSSREHAAVLFTLRDAAKRLSIDTDRVFLSGHSMGGDAAWDIGLAHPDLWAGVIPIVATCGKYVKHYSDNARYVPLYFVCGEKDGDKLAKNADEWNRYVGYVGYDAMIVEYQGRGHEHFHDEILNLFTWMNLHKRDFFVREFAGNDAVASLRPWDNFFWWVECSKFLDANMILPAEWTGDDPPRKPRPATIEGRVLAGGNGVQVTTAARKVTVWLSPDIVSFESPLGVTINGKRQTKVQPTKEVMLEDVRTRGDRQHPFWAKAEN